MNEGRLSHSTWECRFATFHFVFFGARRHNSFACSLMDESMLPYGEPDMLDNSDDLLRGYDRDDPMAFAKSWDFQAYATYIVDGAATPRSLDIRPGDVSSWSGSLGGGLAVAQECGDGYYCQPPPPERNKPEMTKSEGTANCWRVRQEMERWCV
jgi:hypothetical protein